MVSITKKDIRTAFYPDDNHYHIETIKRGKKYKIHYGVNFNRSNIFHSLIARYINDWSVWGRTFIVSV